MRELIYSLLVLTVLLFTAGEGLAQMNRKQIKKNNRQVSTYKGKKFGFRKEKRYNAVGITLNALNYYGDLAPTPSKVSTDISFTRPALSFSFSHRFGPRYTATAAFMYGTLRGSDARSADAADLSNGLFRHNRNLSFRNRIQELSIVASFDLYENQSTYISRVKWTPYLYLGISVFHHNPQAQVPQTDLDGNPFANAGKWVNLKQLGTEGQNANLLDGDVNKGIKPYKLIQPAIPIGFGARFRVNEVMDLSGEFGFRYLFTDYIDDVSRNYVDLGVFGTNEEAKALSYRGQELNPVGTVSYVGRDGKTYDVIAGYGQEYKDNMRGKHSNKDIYTVTTIRLTYIIGKSFHRAKFR